MRRALRETWLIDGYNILGAMDADRQTLHSLAHARDKLADALADFAGFTQVHCILVFDAHHVPQGTGSESDVSGVQVVYTRTQNGRKLILQCRKRSYITYNDKVLYQRKKAISRWE